MDASGCAYVSGTTDSTESTFPVLVGPDLTSNGSLDAFVAKVDPSGAALAYCGYIGGSNLDQGGGIALDALGSAYVAGTAGSDETTFPVKTGPDLVRGGFGSDAFVAKIGPVRRRARPLRLYRRRDRRSRPLHRRGPVRLRPHHGGGVLGRDRGLPATVGPSLSFHGGYCDIFVAKVDPAGTSLLYCGYLGGSSMDIDAGIVLDPSGNAYIAGYRYEPPSGVTAFKVNEAGTAVVLTFTLDDYYGDDRAGGIAPSMPRGTSMLRVARMRRPIPFSSSSGPGASASPGRIVLTTSSSSNGARHRGGRPSTPDTSPGTATTTPRGSSWTARAAPMSLGSVMSGEWWKEFPVIGGPGLEYAGGKLRTPSSPSSFRSRRSRIPS
ncbi:MAG: hypothetical protein MZV65_00010 [Chromatiales bacterium]|nr:hypothetical protein [Chromatiales bacterium]